MAVMASPVEIEAVLDAQQPQRAEADSDQEHDADEQRLQDRVDVEDDQEIADGAHDEGAEDRADGTARSAEQRGATDDHGSDGIERIIGAERRFRRARVGDEGQQQAGNRREQAGEREGKDFRAGDPNSG
jgi:hypothetical protein